MDNTADFQKTPSPKERFQRALSDAAKLYDVQLSGQDIEIFCDEIQAGIMADWYTAVVCLRRIIQKYDIFPTSADLFNMNHNLMDSPDHPIWGHCAAMSDHQFYRMTRPKPAGRPKKTWPGASA